MRLAHGAGFLSGGDVQAYLTSDEPLARLGLAGLVEAAPCPDITLVRPWPGPRRLLACVVPTLPPWRAAPGGYRVVTAERMRRELVGAVGARSDSFALLERLEENGAPGPSPNVLRRVAARPARPEDRHEAVASETLKLTSIGCELVVDEVYANPLGDRAEAGGRAG